MKYPAELMYRLTEYQHCIIPQVVHQAGTLRQRQTAMGDELLLLNRVLKNNQS